MGRHDYGYGGVIVNGNAQGAAGDMKTAVQIVERKKI
jgi:hypothetical protein